MNSEAATYRRGVGSMKTDFEVIYRRIGLLFYAAAFVKGKLTMDGYDKLVDIIKADWPVSDAAGNHQLGDELDRSLLRAVRDAFGESMSPKEAALLFRTYYALHEKTFAPAFKRKILSTYRKIVHEFQKDESSQTSNELDLVLSTSIAGAA